MTAASSGARRWSPARFTMSVPIVATVLHDVILRNVGRMDLQEV